MKGMDNSEEEGAAVNPTPFAHTIIIGNNKWVDLHVHI